MGVVERHPFLILYVLKVIPQRSGGIFAIIARYSTWLRFLRNDLLSGALLTAYNNSLFHNSHLSRELILFLKKAGSSLLNISIIQP